MSTVYRVMRDVQSRFGFALQAKANLQRTMRKLRSVPFESEFRLLSAIEPGNRCMLDIGANRGQSIDAIRMYQPDAVLHAFEPNGLLYRQLETKFPKDQSLVLHKMGLGAEPMEAPLYVPFYRNFMYDGLASFSKSEAEGWLNEDTVWNFSPELVKTKQEHCSIGVLDTLSLKPCFLKIDVQGFEKQVLEGGAKTISKSEPVILIELNVEADKWLLDRGWSRYGFFDGKLMYNIHGDNNTVYLKRSNAEHQKLIAEFS